MNAQTWVEGNNRYLSASLQWLRLRLERLAREVQPTIQPRVVDVAPVTMPHDGVEHASLIGRLRGRPQPSATQAATITPPLLRAAPEISLDEQIAQAAEARVSALHDIDPPPGLALLGQQLGLSPFEQDVLLLCAAMELDTRIASLCARAQGDGSRAYPTFALALALFDDASWDALSPHRPLRDMRLIDINQPGATPLTLSSLRADERIVNYLKGLNELDDRLMTMVAPMNASDARALAPSQQAVADAIVDHWRRTADNDTLPVAQLLGMDALSKDLVTAAVARTLNRRLYRVSAKTLPQQPAELDSFARLWQRESLLTPLALLIDAHAGDLRPDELAALLDRLLARDLGFVLISLREAPARMSRASFVVDVTRPTPAEQQAAWAEVFASRAAADEAKRASQVLAGQFNLNLPEVRRMAAEAGDGASGSLTDAAWDACRAVTRPQLDALAQRIDSKATWDDLVLPDEQTKLLRQIANQVRSRMQVYGAWGFGDKMNRGLGISALFAGSSGTGKTMAAEVIANDLRLNLYRIDLSAVVSKYIGETEKNLRQVFDAAEHGGALLFFDEADSLFGKRSEVKDSHDRYANIEINYLLQRMESYSGLAILATNMKSALDDAFMRRLRFIVDFPYPGQAERKRMWQKAFPPSTPTSELDFARLARLNLTGGNIHSVVLNAAFLAADREPALVTMAVVMEAVRAELRKLDKPVNEAELRV